MSQLGIPHMITHTLALQSNCVLAYVLLAMPVTGDILLP